MTLQLVDVDHSYGRHRSLRSVSLTVRPGDCYGFIGHNGAGKTTAMRIALGLLRPAAGRVLIDGFDAVRFPREARARTAADAVAPATQAVANDHSAFAHSASNTLCAADDGTDTGSFLGIFTVAHGGADQTPKHCAGDCAGCRLLPHGYLIGVNAALIEIDAILGLVHPLHIYDGAARKGFTGTTRQEYAGG